MILPDVLLSDSVDLELERADVRVEGIHRQVEVARETNKVFFLHDDWTVLTQVHLDNKNKSRSPEPVVIDRLIRLLAIRLKEG